jgi:hypothetical protein
MRQSLEKISTERLFSTLLVVPGAEVRRWAAADSVAWVIEKKAL